MLAAALALLLVLGSIPFQVQLDPDLPSGPNAYARTGEPPFQWGSCSITWSTPPGGSSALVGADLADTTKAFAMLSELTGYSFTRVAEAGEITVSVGDPPEPEEQDATGSLDTAGSASVTTSGQYIVAADIVIAPEALASSPSGFATMDANGVLILHELAHAVGLDHVNFKGSLMHPVQLDAPFSLSPGDRAGLAAAGGSCWQDRTSR